MSEPLNGNYFENTLNAGQTLMCSAIYFSYQKPHATLLDLIINPFIKDQWNFSIKFETFKSGWSIIYIEVIFPKKCCISFPED